MRSASLGIGRETMLETIDMYVYQRENFDIQDPIFKIQYKMYAMMLSQPYHGSTGCSLNTTGFPLGSESSRISICS